MYPVPHQLILKSDKVSQNLQRYFDNVPLFAKLLLFLFKCAQEVWKDCVSKRMTQTSFQQCLKSAWTVFNAQMKCTYIVTQILHVFRSIHFLSLLLHMESLALIPAVHGELGGDRM